MLHGEGDICYGLCLCRIILVHHAYDWKLWAAHDLNVLILMSAKLTMVAVTRSVSIGKHVTIKLGNLYVPIKTK